MLSNSSDSQLGAREADAPTKSGAARSALRITQVLLATLAAAASLISFPSIVPWVLAFWLLWFCAAAVRGRLALLPLVMLALVLGAKGFGSTPPVVALYGVVATVAAWRIVDARRNKNHLQKRTALLQIAACWLAWGWLLVDGYFAVRTSRKSTFDPMRPVVCLGDSLTAYGFPELLAERIAAPVINCGRDGVTTADAMEQLPAVLADNPQVVVVELGGHDYLKGYGRDKTRANLEKIVGACRAHGAEVVLSEIPRGLVYDPFHGLERELARKYDLELVADTPIRRLVLWSPFGPPGMWLPKHHQLSDDGLHPNAEGNRLLARYVADALERLYGRDAVRPSD